MNLFRPLYVSTCDVGDRGDILSESPAIHGGLGLSPILSSRPDEVTGATGEGAPTPCPGVPRRASGAPLPHPTDPHPCEVSSDLAAGAVGDPRDAAARPHPYRSPVWFHRPALTPWQRLAVRLLSPEALGRRQWYRRHVGGRWFLLTGDGAPRWVRASRCPADLVAGGGLAVALAQARARAEGLGCIVDAAHAHREACTCEVWP